MRQLLRPENHQLKGAMDSSMKKTKSINNCYSRLKNKFTIVVIYYKEI